MNNITANDGASTPASHVFVPQQGQRGQESAQWFNRTAGSSQTWERLDMRADLLVSAPKSGKGQQDHVARLQLHVPDYVTDEDGNEVIRGYRRFYVTGVTSYPSNSKADLEVDYGLLLNLLAQADVKKVFTDLSAPGL